MPKNDNLQDFLNDLYQGIANKKPNASKNPQNFRDEIESIENSGSSAKLNIAYANTPPADTSKLWLNCNEPSGVEIQNYLGECAVDEVLEYSTIGNPATSNGFKKGYSNPCYIGNNQIAIVGYKHIRIYDLTTKSYIADYTISDIYFEYCTNVIYKDNVLYFGYRTNLYSFNLTTQILTTLYTFSSDDISYISFYNETEINLYTYYSSSNVHRYNLTTKAVTQITRISNRINFMNMYSSSYVVKAGNTLYCFSTSGWKYVDNTDNVTTFTSFTDFIENTFNPTTFVNSSAIYDNERYIYLIGGGNGTIGFDNLIKYDIVNDTFELLDTKLLSGKYNALSVLVDNRVYMFGGDEKTTYGYGRKNYIDYFDLKYPLNENNAIVTTNTINTDVMVNLINEDTIKLKSNVASAYIGNADNLAEKVNAYYHNGNAWLGINCNNPFEWGSLQEQNLFLGETKTFEVPYTNNLNWEMTYDVTSDLEVSNNSNTLTINGGSALGTYPITVTATSSEYNSVYEKTFNVITNNAITWNTISDQTSTSSNSITLDLSTYYTNNSSYDVTLSASSSDNTNFEVSITGNTLTVNCLAVANTTITIEAIVLGITYSVSFNLTAS